jgi:hypothetical protein
MTKKMSDIYNSIRFAKLDPKHEKKHKGGSQDDEEHGAVDSQEFAQQVAHVKKRSMQEENGDQLDESPMSAAVKLQKALEKEKQKRQANDRYKEELKKRGEAIANKQKNVTEASYTGKGNHRPGWMLRADPELARKVKEKTDAAKLRQKYMGKTSAEIEKMRKNVAEEKEMKGEDPCWKGYEMVGMKNKNGRKVPNCVPVKESRKLSVVKEAIKQAKKKMKDAQETKESEDTFQKEPVMSKEITKV